MSGRGVQPRVCPAVSASVRLSGCRQEAHGGNEAKRGTDNLKNPGQPPQPRNDDDDDDDDSEFLPCCAGVAHDDDCGSDGPRSSAVKSGGVPRPGALRHWRLAQSRPNSRYRVIFHLVECNEKLQILLPATRG